MSLPGSRPLPVREQATRAGRDAPRILIADDEQSMREWLRILFQRDGFDVLVAEDGVAARDLVARDYVDVVLTDIRMPRMDGLDLLKAIREIAPDVVVIMMTAHFTRDSAEWKRARDSGAAALLEKPFRDINLVTLQVRQLIEARRIRHERDVLRQAIAKDGFAGIIGRSRPMLDVFRLVETVCRTNSTVLLTGESGTGKELVARALHLLSLRRDHPFVAVNCGALPEGLLESELFGHVRGAFSGAVRDHQGLFQKADQGTLFLDEIGDMPLSLQAKLLRVLEENQVRPVGSTDPIPVDVRIVSATHRALESRIAEGLFREDLYYRISVVVLEVPPLSARREDILLLASQFLKRFAEKYGRPATAFAPEALDLLIGADWPGNVRQLQNVVEQTVTLCPTPVIPAAFVQEAMRLTLKDYTSFDAAKKDFERDYLTRLLRITEGNVSRAARLAQRHRTDFYKLLQRNQIDPGLFKKS
jgi:two-component system, NtrC family, response regulator GlrR